MIDPETHLIAKLVTKGKLLRFGRFKLSNGIETPYFLDFTLLSSRIDLLNTLIDHINRKILVSPELEKIDKFIGIMDKGAVITIPLALARKTPFSLVDPDQVEIRIGVLNTFETPLLIDDMISTGETILKVVNTLREKYGVEVENILVILDREEGGYEKLVEKGLNVYRVVTISEVIEALWRVEAITEEEYNTVMEHLRTVKG